MRAEHVWWSAVVLWVLVVLFWRPDPPLPASAVPSARTDPEGYRIFYDLLKKEGVPVRRAYRRATRLSDDVEVMVMLTPQKGVPKTAREELMDWVTNGGQLVIGHPIYDEYDEIITDFGRRTSVYASGESRMLNVTYLSAYLEDDIREVPSFDISLAGEMVPEGELTSIIAIGAEGEAVITADDVGAGRVFQIADASLFGNEALGRQRSHLLAAALVDEIGRDQAWRFDESNEGVSIVPDLAAVIGNSPFRFLFLHAILVLLFFYWRGSARLGKPLNAPKERQVREVTTLAQDVGDFYYRSGRGGWALRRYFDYFKHVLKEQGAYGRESEKTAALIREVKAALENGDGTVDTEAALISEMAAQQHALTAKGKRKRK